MDTPNIQAKIIEALTGDEPISKSEIRNLLSIDISDKTLQRNLAEMYASGMIDHQGEKKGRKYFLPKKSVLNKRVQLEEVRSYDDSFFQAQSLESLYHVRKPIYERTRVSYNRNLLDKYIPNKKFYLTADEREKLRIIGKRTKGMQPAGTYAKRILNQLLIDLSFNSARLEGNTFTLADTKNLFASGKLAEGKDKEEVTMILNHKEAISFLVEAAASLGVSIYTITNLHAALSTDLLPPKLCGKIREEGVGISGSVYTPPAELHIIEELFGILINKASAIEDPFEQSLFLLLHLPYLQPFEDVNKRTSRLACNIPLIKDNMSPMAFIDLPKDAYTDAIIAFYELNDHLPMKDLFLWSYKRSSDHYKTQIESFGEIDALRIKYRSERRKVISYLINNNLGQDSAELAAKSVLADVPEEHWGEFISHIKEDLENLHEGNLIGLSVTLSQFNKWKKI
jgi:Fic family protein